MTGTDYREQLHQLKFTAGFNARYHHRLEWFWGVGDKGIRIAVGVLAIAGLILAISDVPPWGVTVAVVSLVAAAALNIVPVGDWEKRHGELFRLWSDLRKDADMLDLKGCDFSDEEHVPSHCPDRLVELRGKEHQLNAQEPLPIRRLLRWCEDDEREAIYGKGIRTPEQVEKELDRQRRAATSASGVA